MIPRLYLENETNFNHNGIGALTESLSAVVIEEANGIFDLEVTYPIHGKWLSEIQKMRIITALPNTGDEEHRFRINEIVKSTNPNVVIIKASTKTNDISGSIIKEYKASKIPANTIMSGMKSKLFPPLNYDFLTDITTSISVDWFMRNPLNAILGQEGSLVDALGGGELKRNNTNLYLYRRRGNENVARVAPSKNLRGLTVTESTKGLITRIQPYVIVTDYDDSSGEQTETVILGDVVDSPLVNNYPVQVVVPVDFGEYEITNKTDLDTKAKTYFTSMNPDCDKPNVELDLDLIQISDSSEYEKFRKFEAIKLFDTVSVYVPRYGVDSIVKINRVEFDVLREKVISIKAGQPRSSYSQSLEKTYNNKINDALVVINNKINTVQQSADGKNQVFRGPNEPDISVSNEGDLWFKVLGNGEVEMYTFDGAYWQPNIPAGMSEEISKKIEEFETSIEQQGKDIDESIIKANQAVEDAGFAKNQSATALSQAGQAVADANTAITDAQSALDAYRNMDINERNYVLDSKKFNRLNSNDHANYPLFKGTDSIGNWISGYRNNNPTQFFISAFTPLYNDTTAFSKDAVELVGNTITISIKFMSSEAITVRVANEGKDVKLVPNVWTTVYSALQAGSGAPSILSDGNIGISSDAKLYHTEWKIQRGNVFTGWSPAPEDVQVQITDINGELSRKVSQQTFDTLQGTVNTQSTQINQNKADILLRATKTEVNTLTGTVNSLDSQLKVEAGKITALNSKTDGHTTQIGSLESSFSGLNSTVATVKQDLDGLDIGYNNMILKSDTFSPRYAGYQGTTLSMTSYDATEEWGFKDAFSVTTTGGTNNTKAIWTMATGNTISGMLLDVDYTYSVYIKNIGSNDIDFRINGLGTPPNSQSVQRIPKGVSKRLIFTGQRRPTYNWLQTHIQAVGSVDQSIKFIIGHEKLEKGNKATDWSLAPEEMATVTQFSSLEQTVNGFQTVVQGKADKSEVTQLSGQITSIIRKKNILPYLEYGTLNSSNGMEDTATTTIRSPFIKVQAGKTYRLSTVNPNPPNNKIELSFNTYYYDSKFNFVRRVSAINSGVDRIQPTSGEVYARVTRSNVSVDLNNSQIEEGEITTEYSPFVGMNESQITQLIDNINLRVKKDDLIGEINIQAGKTIFRQGDNVMMITPTTTYIQDATIKTAHIADLAVSGAKIANASISSAKIISLDASKVSATTLSAITTNTGALNVSGNLTMTTDNTRIIGSFAYGETASSAYNPRYFEGGSSFGRRFISFTGNVYNATTSGGKGTHRYYSESFFGHDYFKLRAYSSDGGALLSRVDGNGLGIEIGDTWGAPKITLTNGAVTAQRLYGGRLDTGPSFNTIIIGEVGNIASMQFATSNIYFNHLRNDLADFRIGADGVGKVVSSEAVYNRTYSSAANMYITSAGTFGRSVSAKKYKTDIISESMNKSKLVLQIKPSSWYDKEALRKGKEPKRYYGFIADDFHKLGLTEVVQYGADGQVEGLAYDRISIYHNVILKDHEKQLTRLDDDLKQTKGSLKHEIEHLKSIISSLKHEVEMLRQSA